MPKLNEDSVLLLKGKVVLYKWSKSPYWQVRFRIGRKWIRKTTKTEDITEAEEIAFDFYYDAKHKEKNNLPVTSQRFKSVALAVKHSLQKTIDAGQGKSVYKDYVQVIDRYLIPYFGKHAVHTIDYPLLKQFNTWRIDKMKKVPARSTINTHTAALNRVFNEAVARRYMASNQIPELKVETGHGKQTERRADFSLVEYRQLYRLMRSFVKQKPHRNRTKMMRDLMRDFVLFVANTGVRPGTETANLLWRNIRIDNGIISISVSGKTGRRDAIMRRGALRYLQRIAERAEDFEGMSFEDVLKTDKKVFRLADGSETDNLRQTFKNFLIYAELLKCPHTGQDRTLYSLRHFYATQALIYQRVPIEYLAVQMGTSIGMIEKHYGHLSVFQVKEQLS